MFAPGRAVATLIGAKRRFCTRTIAAAPLDLTAALVMHALSGAK